MEPTMQITISMPCNADNSSIAAALRMRAGLFEGMTAKDAASRKNTDGAKAQSAADEDDTDFGTPTTATKTTKGKKAAATFDDDDDTAMGASAEETETDEDEDFTAPTKKTAKAKKLTIDNVNDACKARAAGGRREEVLKLLKKHFKTQSVSDLTEAQWAECIKVMKA